MKMSNKVFDILAYIQRIALPAIAMLWAALGKIWGWPLVPEIAATISAIDVCLGALLKISTNQYNQQQNQPPIESGEEEE